MSFGPKLPLATCPKCGHRFEYNEMKEWENEFKKFEEKVKKEMKNNE